MGYAKRPLRPLSKIAIIDDVTLESIVNSLPPGGYVHPSTHPASIITEDTTHQFITATQKNNIHESGSDNQDLSNLVVKETGKSLVSDTLISNIHEPSSDNQVIPTALSELSDDSTHRLVTDAEKSSWGGGGGLTQSQIRRRIC